MWRRRLMGYPVTFLKAIQRTPEGLTEARITTNPLEATYLNRSVPASRDGSTPTDVRPSP